MAKLTLKRENFCLAYVENGDATESYRIAYGAQNMKPETLWSNSSRLLKDAMVQARIEELRAPVREKVQITLESHLERLNSLSTKAEEAGQFGPAIKAEESRGKASGLYVEKIDHSSSDGSMTPKGRSLKDFYEEDVPPKSGT